MFSSGSAYSIDHSSYGEQDRIIFQEIVPLKARVKRQATISLPPPSNKTLSEKLPQGVGVGSTWANKTRDPIPNAGQSPHGGNLLRNPENSFLPNNATSTTPSPEKGDAGLLNGTSVDDNIFGVNYTEYATTHNLTEKVG